MAAGEKMDGRASGGRERQREKHKWPTKLEGFAHDGRLGRSAEVKCRVSHRTDLCSLRAGTLMLTQFPADPVFLSYVLHLQQS